MKKLLAAMLAVLSMFALASCNSDDILSNIETMICKHRDANDNGVCDECGTDYADGTDKTICQHRDKDDNGRCDKCNAYYSDGMDVSACQHRDANDDNLCDKCESYYSDGKDKNTCQHRDANDDNWCDKCRVIYSDGVDIPGEPDCEHDFKLATIAPTCENKGYGEKECTLCGIVMRVNYVDALGHDMGEASIAVAPTCTENGTSIAYCERDCGHSVTAVIEATGHEWSEEYSYDETNHWKDCANCDETDLSGEHTIDASGYCTVCDQPLGSTEGIIYDISVDGTFAEVVGYTGTAKRVVIDDTYEGLAVKTIYSNAFKNLSITSVVIPDSVTSIGSNAFQFCYSLSNVTFKGENISIGYNAFSYCSTSLYSEYEFGTYVGDEENPYAVLIGLTNKNLRTYKINEATKSIAYDVFENCTRLTDITIPHSVTNIGAYAFSGCYNLNSIYYKGTEDDWNNINISINSSYSGNSGFINATRYYYSESEPEVSGNYWHYDENGEIAIW